jgi:hypothetical protein
MSNLYLWDKLKKTDPSHTKPFTRAGGFSGTSVRPIYSLEKMTETFGPCGIGWGMTPPEYQLVPGPDNTTLVFCTVGLWYVENARRSELVFGVGGDSVVVTTAKGIRGDDEAFKKAYTDALTNAMKHIGMSADIHMNMFADTKYVDSVKAEIAAEKAESNVVPIQQNKELLKQPEPPKETSKPANPREQWVQEQTDKINKMDAVEIVHAFFDNPAVKQKIKTLESENADLAYQLALVKTQKLKQLQEKSRGL